MLSKLPEYSWRKKSDDPCGFSAMAVNISYAQALNLFPVPDDTSDMICIVRYEAIAYNLCQIIYDLLGQLENLEKKRKNLEEEYSFIYWVVLHLSRHAQESSFEHHKSFNKKKAEINICIWEICKHNENAMTRIIMPKNFFDTGIVIKNFSKASRQNLRKKIRKISCLFRYMRKTDDTYIFSRDISEKTFVPSKHLQNILGCLDRFATHLQNIINWNSTTTLGKGKILCKIIFNKINFSMLSIKDFMERIEFYDFTIKGFAVPSFRVRLKKEGYKVRKFAILTMDGTQQG